MVDFQVSMNPGKGDGIKAIGPDELSGDGNEAKLPGSLLQAAWELTMSNRPVSRREE